MSISLYKCDKCKREFPYKGIGFQYYPVSEDTSVARTTTYGHLCKGCAEKWLAWLADDTSQTKFGVE